MEQILCRYTFADITFSLGNITLYVIIYKGGNFEIIYHFPPKVLVLNTSFILSNIFFLMVYEQIR